MRRPSAGARYPDRHLPHDHHGHVRKLSDAGRTWVRVNPANMAKSLGKSRVLHFKDPDAAIGYRDEFGYGMVADGMMAHLGNGARLAANMKVLGPNPKVMFDAMAEDR